MWLLCSVSLSHDAMGCSAVCDCRIFWSYTSFLTVFPLSSVTRFLHNRMQCLTVLPTKSDSEVILFFIIVKQKTNVYTSLELTLIGRSLLY